MAGKGRYVSDLNNEWDLLKETDTSNYDDLRNMSYEYRESDFKLVLTFIHYVKQLEVETSL
jgi:hypothetical protein